MIKPKYPPGPDENGKLLTFECPSCGHRESEYVSFQVDNFTHTAKCECGGKMKVDLQEALPAVKNTWSSNRRKAKDLTQRNEKMKTKQWDNHDVGIDRKDVQTGRRKFPNATKGGPLDLNSKFNKRTK